MYFPHTLKTQVLFCVKVFYIPERICEGISELTTFVLLEFYTSTLQNPLDSAR